MLVNQPNFVYVFFLFYMNRIVVRCASTSKTIAAVANAKPSEKPNNKPQQTSKAVESPSFAMNLFRGQLKLDEIFPYPYALNEEQRDTLQALVDPTAKFFEVRH
jgi:hypothetical protein